MELATLAVAILLPIASWLYADARGKGRAEALDVAVKEHKTQVASLEERLRRVENQTAADHQTIDGFTIRLDDLRMDIDRRFDRLEALIAPAPTRRGG